MNDPVRDWLRQLLASELGHRQGDQMIQAAIVGRGWPAMQPFGPREVVAVLQDMYAALRPQLGEARADKWVESATQAFADFMQSGPATAPTPEGSTQEPVRPAVPWGRRAHDLPLLLARVHFETAQRSLDAVRVTPELSGLERAAGWDLQAAQAELRRWEAEDRLSNLRAEHARVEMAEQVRSARAQEQLLDLTVRELEDDLKTVRAPLLGDVPGGSIHPLRMQLSHNRLMLTQTRSFLEVFAPLVDEHGADAMPEIPAFDLSARLQAVNVQRHPNVLRARHALNYAEWQAGAQGQADPRMREAQAGLARAEAEAQQVVQDTLNTARQHYDLFRELQGRFTDLERRVNQLRQFAADPLTYARAQFEAQQVRGALRLHSHRLVEALGLLDALGSGDAGSADVLPVELL
ncbi:hypothetical protein [Deinococcus ruber]|uniref:Uncharacterized protein n=1 Tax=Deinococcus ruber TaxID=1848197 RepID=A0A918EZ26_9DEIO|nr:hypothetical protein [Deinococcus ruber]GGQ92598.1 hypothetical protein GCM10008957_00670 [Deinococcus ruber]